LNGWLLDTNVVAELARANGDARVAAWASSALDRHLFMSVLTLGEYDKGIAALPQTSALRPKVEAHVLALEQRFAGRILQLSDSVVRRWGRISGSVLASTGKAPPVIDTLLAACAVEHGLHLATRNVKDVRDSGASVFNPWTDDPSRFPLS
jgi:toxin FitB